MEPFIKWNHTFDNRNGMIFCSKPWVNIVTIPNCFIFDLKHVTQKPQILSNFTPFRKAIFPGSDIRPTQVMGRDPWLPNSSVWRRTANFINIIIDILFLKNACEKIHTAKSMSISYHGIRCSRENHSLGGTQYMISSGHASYPFDIPTCTRLGQCSILMLDKTPGMVIVRLVWEISWLYSSTIMHTLRFFLCVVVLWYIV